MPRPKVLGQRRIAWDVRELDAAVDRLPVTHRDEFTDDTWGDIDAA